MKCPECGSEVSAGIQMCPACGASLAINGNGAVASTGTGFASRHFERLLFAGGLLLVSLGAYVLVKFGWDLPWKYAGKQLDHANGLVDLLFIAIVGTIIATIVSAQAGRVPFIRRIAGLNAIDEAVGRATEMGRPILFSGGLAGIGIVSLQALAVATHVARSAVRYGTRMIVPVCDQTMMPVTEEVMREVYTAEGRPESFRPEDIRFLSDRQFAYAAGVTGILHRERVAASFLFGQFYAESLILAENGQAVGAIQVAGTPDLLCGAIGNVPRMGPIKQFVHSYNQGAAGPGWEETHRKPSWSKGKYGSKMRVAL